MPALTLLRFLLPSALAVALAGCVSGTAPGEPARPIAETDAETNVATAAETVTADASAPESAPESPSERAFPEDSVYPLLLAEFALRRGDHDRALDTYLEQAAVLRDPGISAHLTHLAQFLQREPEALEAVRLWVELEPEHPEANATLATLLIRQLRPLEAIEHLATVARQGLKANFTALLGGFRQLPRERQLALRDKVSAIASELPGDIELLLAQALILDELGQKQAQRQVLTQLFALEPWHIQGLILDAKLRLEADEPDPFQRIEEALATQPDNTTLRLHYARLLTRSDIDAARRQFEILSAQSPRDGDLLLSLALINQETGDTLAAAAYLQQMLKLEHRTDEAHYYLGRLAENQGRRMEAIAAYSQVEDPDSREFFSARGRVGRLLLLEEGPLAVADFFAGQRLKYPELREQLYTLESEVLNQAGLAEASMEVLNRALAELPDSVALRYSRSMLAEQQDQLALMESDLRGILAREPDNATALNALGYSLGNRTERYEEAYQLISRALEYAPDEPAILDSMGWVLFKRGAAEQALAYLQRAYKSMPDPEVAAHLGEVLWSLDKGQEAYSVWREGLQRDPEHPVLLETLRRLDVTIRDLTP
ncbi:hypothetical protein CWI75_05430 [Kineobactrum sediminis]|uniref:Tetratricopeptide repeat protein n=1 Tax=Kineobactrum sediminis TaxID=1905677 RepID=A0A2N5Y3C7_9GAMM|nr:tetratricopeptide repeat protein [Kineobactrum sediminis]PLW82889.1 hypothetical protein CWI75_05430 [Kineobactrum sediminis]